MNPCVSDFTLGVVMLDTRFPRPVGDIGNPATFPFATRYRTVPKATVASVATAQDIAESLVGAVTGAALDLAAEGADLIATSCGFLAPLQDRLQARVAVPVLTSSLLLLPTIRARCGAGPVGILTFDSRRLSPRHFGPYFDSGDVVEGIESGAELYTVIDEDRDQLDVERAAADTVAAAQRLVARYNGLRAILFECTNLSPYRDAVAAATGLPVFDINQAIVDHAGGHELLGCGARNA